jgi:hypothetical protein
MLLKGFLQAEYHARRCLHVTCLICCRDIVEYAEKVRRAVSTAAVLLDNEWTRMVESGVANVQDNAGEALHCSVSCHHIE